MDQVTLQQKCIDFANILKAFIGSIYLSMPFAFYQSGIVMGLILTIIIALINDHCCMKIVKCKTIIINRLMEQFEQKHQSGLLAKTEAELLLNGRLRNRLEDRMTISHISKYAFGKKGQWIVTFCLFLSQMGFCSNYMVFVGSTIYDMAYGESSPGNSTTVDTYVEPINDLYESAPTQHINLIYFVIIPIPIFALFALLRSIRNMGWISIIANITITIGSIMVLGILFNGFIVNPTYNLFRWDTLAVVFGMLTTAFEGIGTVISIESSMTGNRHNFNNYLHATIGIIVVILAVFGVFGHLRYGRDVKQIILLNFESSVILIIVNVILIVSVLCTYPLQMFPCVEIFEFLFFRKRSAEIAAEKRQTLDDIQEEMSDAETGGKKSRFDPEGINDDLPGGSGRNVGYQSDYMTDDQAELLAELSASESEDEIMQEKQRRKRRRRYRKARKASIANDGLRNYGAVTNDKTITEVDEEAAERKDQTTGQENEFVTESILTKKQERMMRIVHNSKITAPTWKRNCVRIGIVAVQLIIAILMRYNFAYLNAFVGALGSSVLAYMLPGAVHYKLTRFSPSEDDKACSTSYHKCMDIFVIIFGIVGSIVTLVTTIRELIIGA